MASSLDDYLKDLNNHEMVDRDEELELARRARQGDDQAAQELATANLRFVVSVAKKYQNRGVSLADLIQDGNVGLLRAVRKFDPDEGVKFISYAVWWIRQAILQSISENRGQVRIPLNTNAERSKAVRTCDYYVEQGYSRSEAIDYATRDLRAQALEAGKSGSRWTREHVEFLLSLGQEKSLDDTISDDDDSGTFMARFDPENESLDDHLYSVQRREILDDAFERYVSLYSTQQSSPRRDIRILRLYFGLTHEEDNPEGESLTLEEIGHILGVTRERVRQIKDKAQSRLKDDLLDALSPDDYAA